MGEAGMLPGDPVPPPGWASGMMGVAGSRSIPRHPHDGTVTSCHRQRALEDLAEGLAHDLKNQLTVVGAAVQLARGRDARGADDFLDRAWRAAMRAAGLVDEVLAYSRAVGMADGPQCSDLAVALETAVAGTWSYAARCGVALEMRFAVQQLPAVNCSPTGLRLLLVHLLRRSTDACCPGVHLVVEAGQCGSMATVAVQRVLPPSDLGADARQTGAESPHRGWVCDLDEVCALAEEVGAFCTARSSGPVVWMRVAESGVWDGGTGSG